MVAGTSMRSKLKTWRREMVSVLLGLMDLLWFLTSSVQKFLYNKTLPVTRRLLSRVPRPPIVTVKDIRANRIRLNIESSLSSIFNVEMFEIEWRPKGLEEWTSAGFNHLSQRTVARLPGDSLFEFRVRARNERGTSNWCPIVTAKTRLDPKDGGGYGPGYIWAQTPSDVTITFKMPTGVMKKDIKLTLKGDYLKVEVQRPPAEGEPNRDIWVPLEGKLYGKVVSFENGSFWELVKEDGNLVLILTLEKAAKSVAPKFDYWRSIQPGHPELEIDTHKITSEEARTGMQMLQPGKMDPAQLHAMGLGSYAM